MGQTITKAPQVQVREPRGSTQQEINDLYKTKASYYAVPESKWDDLPECYESLPYTPFVLSCNELLEIAALPKGDNHRTYVLSQVFTSLEKGNFFVLKRNEQSMEEYASLLSEMATFFALPEEEKTAFAAPTTKQASGYLKLFFDNRTSRRDPEHRDLFQIRYGEDGTIPWPYDSFKQVATTHYTAQWNIAVTIFRLIVEEFDLGSDLLEQTIANDFSKSKIAEEERKQMHGNTNTNLTLFHYYDTHNYTSTQKCMVHQDRGLVTLLPKTTVSGLQIMLNDQWYHPEAHIADDEMLVYFGLAMKHLTGSRIKSLRHRVVRQPHMERYSSPFELKPNDDAVLGPDFTFFNLVRSLEWKGIQNQVNRADSVEQQ